MKLEEFHIGQKVMIAYSSEDWYLDWKDDRGPFEVVSISRLKNRQEEVVIDTNGWYCEFKPSELDEYKEPSRLESVGICDRCCEAILECSCR